MGDSPDFSSMNETDVRETIVRPLIESLGYKHGTDATIRTEVTLRYPRSFLGRKNPKKDPELNGRADYICDVISYGRWVVEVKSPDEELSQDVVEQAHTYAAHPEIAASHFLVTNGREFKLYQTSKLDEPLLKWDYEMNKDDLLRFQNILSPDAVRKRAKANLRDIGKPLGKGLASRLRVTGGYIECEEHTANHPFFENQSLNGVRLPVICGCVYRTDDKQILVRIEFANPAPLMFVGESEMPKIFDYLSAAEYISDDPEHPSIFQNQIKFTFPAGRLVNFPGRGRIPTLFEMSFSVFAQATGYIEGERFVGTARLSHETDLSTIPASIKSSMFHNRMIPEIAHVEVSGRFEILLAQDI